MDFSNEFLHRVSANKIKGMKMVYKFGTGDLNTSSYKPISCTGLYQMPTTVEELEIVSDNANDTILGTGARTVSIEGIGSDWGLASTTVNMNGTTPVPLPVLFRRVFRVSVVTSGSYSNVNLGPNAGDIMVRGLGGGDNWGGIMYHIGLATGTSLIAAYTVPINHSVNIVREEIYSANKELNLALTIRKDANIITAPFSPSKVQRLSRSREGSDTILKKGLGQTIHGPADIWYSGKTSSGTAEASVSFDMLLINNNLY